MFIWHCMTVESITSVWIAVLSVGLPGHPHVLGASISGNIKYHGSERAPRPHDVSVVSFVATEEKHVGALSCL